MRAILDRALRAARNGAPPIKEQAAPGFETPRVALPLSSTDSTLIMERLKKRADFVACRSGRRAHGTGFTLQLLRRADGGAFRVGFTVTKKIGNAVTRNHIKRRLREAVRAGHFPPEAAGCDCVLLAKLPAQNQGFAVLTGEIERAVVHALKARAKTRFPRPVPKRANTGLDTPPAPKP